MKKVKLLALMLAASISLTACGTDGGTKKAGVFAGVKTADRISTNKYYTIDKVRVREIANLVNEMDYEEIEGDIPDVFFEDSNEEIFRLILSDVRMRCHWGSRHQSKVIWETRGCAM